MTTAPTTDLWQMTPGDFEALAETLEAHVIANTPKPKARSRYNRRDRLGRFVKAVRVEECQFVTGFFNGADDVTHGHEMCGGLKNVAYTHDAHQNGWLCTGCIDVPASAMSHTKDCIGKSGSAMCDSCERTLKVTAFPTAMVEGWKVRLTTCRKCRDANKVSKPKPETIDALAEWLKTLAAAA